MVARFSFNTPLNNNSGLDDGTQQLKQRLSIWYYLPLFVGRDCSEFLSIFAQSLDSDDVELVSVGSDLPVNFSSSGEGLGVAPSGRSASAAHPVGSFRMP